MSANIPSKDVKVKNQLRAQKSKYIKLLKAEGIKNEFDREAVEYLYPTSMDRGSVSCIFNATTLHDLDINKKLLFAHLRDLKESVVGDKLSTLFSPIGKEVTPIRWLLKGIMEENSINQIFGPSGHGKSFVVIDMAIHLLNGMDWNGHKAKLKPTVLYIAGEGQGGVNLRVKAAIKDTELSADGFYVSNTSIDMLDEEKLELLVDLIDEIDGPVWCIIDTLNRNFTGDENSSKDMARLYSNIDKLREVGATFTIVHHTGHSAQDRSRGSSSLKGAMDGELKVSMDNTGVITVENTKAKNVSKQNDIGFKTKVVVFGQDEDGDDITSLQLKSIVPEFAKKRKKYEQEIIDFVRTFGNVQSTSNFDLNVHKNEVRIGRKRALEHLLQIGLMIEQDGILELSEHFEH